jgi:hypothetical protein
MNYFTTIAYGKILRRKLALIGFIAFSTMAAFATLGDGKKANTLPSNTKLLSGRTATNNFTLRSGYSFRGSQVLNSTSEKKYINLNTTLTVQKGNTTYVVPLKKKVVVANVKIDLGNRSFQRH